MGENDGISYASATTRDGSENTLTTTLTHVTDPPVEAPQLRDQNERPECFSSTFQECVFVLTTTMAIGQYTFFTGMTTGINASIAMDLHMTSAQITWISAGAALSSGAFLLPFGKLADMFGRKPIFIAGMGGFSIALLIAGFATNPLYLDIFSGILGLCSAAVVPPAAGALGAAYEKPSKRKNRAFACFSAGNPLGFVGGNVVSGVASRLYSWRASYWSLAVCYAIFTALTVWTVPNDTGPREPFNWRSLKKFDALGCLLAVSGFALLSTALTLAGDAPEGWKTGYVLSLFLVGIFLIAAFLVWQHFFKYPLMPLYLWKDRNFSLLMIVQSLGFMGFMSTAFWLSLYLQRLKGLDALGVAVQLLPQFVNGVLVNIIVALVLHRVNNRILMAIGTLGYFAAFLILGFMDPDATYWAYIFPALLLYVVGADIHFNIVNMYVMSSLPTSHQSLASGIFNTVQKICTNVGLGISTAVFNAASPHPGTNNDNNHNNPQMASITTKAIKPYLATYRVSAAMAGLSLFFIYFMTIRTQGGDSDSATSDNSGGAEMSSNATTVVDGSNGDSSIEEK